MTNTHTPHSEAPPPTPDIDPLDALLRHAADSATDPRVAGWLRRLLTSGAMDSASLARGINQTQDEVP